MKATLSFNLPEEEEDFKWHKNGPKYHSIIFTFLNEFCRRKIKYESDMYSKEYIKALEDARDFVHSELSDKDISGDF